MNSFDFNKERKNFISCIFGIWIVYIVILLISLTITIKSCNKLCKAVDENGMKNIIEQIWKGPMERK